MFNDSRVLRSLVRRGIKRALNALPRYGADPRHSMEITRSAADHFKSHHVFAKPAWIKSRQMIRKRKEV
jgi:hypothetical protein